MNFREFLKNNRVYLDGGTGTLLQAQGLAAGELPERWNLTHASEIVALHESYFNAGSNVVCTNTFGANTLHFDDAELEKIICAAVENAKIARENSQGTQEKFIALDIGPSGKLLQPYGDLDFEDAVALFAKTVKIGARCGVDLVCVETMNDSYETKAAVLAVKENCDLPVIVTNAYGADGKLMTGASPEAMTAMLEGLGADAIGANCSLGPKQLAPVAERLLACASVPVVVKPNAGLPAIVDGKTVFDVGEVEFANELAALVAKGVRVVGGCCGTTPAFIRAVKEKTSSLPLLPVTEKDRTVVSSYTHAVAFGEKAVLIGERINPTGKKRFKQALREQDDEYILREGVTQQERGAHILDVNVGLPEIDEAATLERIVCRLQAVCDLPLQIDSSDPIAMERALRRYNGKPMINSVNGKRESMEAVFPLVKKYGGVVVALTLDEAGIPQNAGGRVEITEKILREAAAYGIKKKDLIFDPLAMAVSADGAAAKETLAALKEIRTRLHCHTSLGVSNVSFGLPCRDGVNAAFFALALENGLSAAIMNPNSAEMMRTYYAYNALKGLDENCAAYIAAAESFAPAPVAAAETPKTVEKEYRSDLERAIVKGLKNAAAVAAREALQNAEANSIVNGDIIPALDRVGEGFEKGRLFLPQLLMSAEAAKSAFEEIAAHVRSTGAATEIKGTFVLATVQGDIHDIGKNIVRLLLENYGFEVIDLGRDVPPERIVEAVEKHRAPLAGLSALMTTTVPAMEETVRLLRARTPWCRIVVGGAVLTHEYAEKMGADFYAKDAMATVRYAENVIEEEK